MRYIPLQLYCNKDFLNRSLVSTTTTATLNTTMTWNTSSTKDFTITSSPLPYPFTERESSFSTTFYSFNENKTTPLSLSANKTTPVSLSANKTTPVSLSANKTTPVSFPADRTTTQSETTISYSTVEKYSNETMTLNATEKSDNQTFIFFAGHKNENSTELYVGMKTTVRLTLICPPGFYDTIVIGLEGDIKNIDLESNSIKSGSSIINQEYGQPFRPYYSETGFQRISFMYSRWKAVNVSSSPAASDRQLTCDFVVFFHNSEGVQEGQNISTVGFAKIKSGKSFTNLERKTPFTARTSILPINKSALYELDNSAVSGVTAEVKTVTDILFRSWMPYYDPKVKIILKGNLQSSGFALYLRVLRAGRNFYPGVQVEKLLACKILTNTDEVTLNFPSQWVNRGYYNSENTTDDDLIEFEAGVVLSESAIIGANYSAIISILVNDIQDWSSAITLIVNSSSNKSIATVTLSRDSSEELLPNTATSLILEISTRMGTSDNLDLRVFTSEFTGRSQAAIEIENILIDKEKTNSVFVIDCTPVNVSFSYSKTQNSSIQNLSDGTLSFINPTANELSNIITLIVHLRVHSSTARFGDTHVVTAVIDKSISEHNITINKPEVFQDKNGDLLSKANIILDGNEATCFSLPVRGDNPPLFWMKIDTTWLNISSTAYNVTVVGEKLSCKPNGQRILQVYFPITISKNGLHEEVEFCNMESEDFISNENRRECLYSCKCRNTNECGELVLFMANLENTFAWSLCELKARNV